MYSTHTCINLLSNCLEVIRSILNKKVLCGRPFETIFSKNRGNVSFIHKVVFLVDDTSLVIADGLDRSTYTKDCIELERDLRVREASASNPKPNALGHGGLSYSFFLIFLDVGKRCEVSLTYVIHDPISVNITNLVLFHNVVGMVINISNIKNHLFNCLIDYFVLLILELSANIFVLISRLHLLEGQAIFSILPYVEDKSFYFGIFNERYWLIHLSIELFAEESIYLINNEDHCLWSESRF